MGLPLPKRWDKAKESMLPRDRLKYILKDIAITAGIIFMIAFSIWGATR